MSDLTHASVKGRWSYVCLLIDHCSREIVGRAASGHKGADLVKAAPATPTFDLSEIEVFHTDRGSESADEKVDEIGQVLDIKRSLSRKGDPCDDTVIEPADEMSKRELVCRQPFIDPYDLRLRLNDYTHWYNHKLVQGTTQASSFDARLHVARGISESRTHPGEDVQVSVVNPNGIPIDETALKVFIDKAIRADVLHISE